MNQVVQVFDKDVVKLFSVSCVNMFSFLNNIIFLFKLFQVYNVTLIDLPVVKIMTLIECNDKFQ